MNKEAFYARCAELLDTDHTYVEKPQDQNRVRHDGSIRNTYRNRWNNRDPGNGRFLGNGLIRHFGRLIHVNLRDPVLHGYFESEEDALAAIEQAGVDAVVREAQADYERAIADPELQREIETSRERRRALIKQLSEIEIE